MILIIWTYSKGMQKAQEGQKMRRCYKCNKVGHLAKDCKSGQKIKIWQSQEDLDKDDNDKKEGFVKDLE